PGQSQCAARLQAGRRQQGGGPQPVHGGAEGRHLNRRHLPERDRRSAARDHRLDYDPTKFIYLGSGANEVPICIAPRDGPIQTFQDLMSRELITSVTGPGGTNHDFPVAMAGLLGVKFKFVKGYTGGAQLGLAIERNEVQGLCGSWSYTKIQYPDILTGTL